MSMSYKHLLHFNGIARVLIKVLLQNPEFQKVIKLRLVNILKFKLKLKSVEDEYMVEVARE